MVDGLGDRFVPGQTSLSAAQMNEIREACLRYMRTVPAASGARGITSPAGSSVDVPGELTGWWGVVTTTGPQGLDEDWTDARYWVKRGYCTNSYGGQYEALEFASKETPGPHAEPQPIVCVYNLAEHATQGHLLIEGQPVYVSSVADVSDDRKKRYVMNATSGIGGIPAIVTACYRESNGVTWATCRKQTALPYTPQPILDPQTDNNDFLVWCGIDAPIVLYSAVLLVPVYIPDEPQIKYKGIPDLPIDPNMIDEPPPEAVTSWVNPFDPLWPSDSCVEL